SSPCLQRPIIEGSRSVEPHMPHACYNPEFPFTAATRVADRDQLLANIVSAIWDSVLGLAVLLRTGAEDLDGHPSGPTMTASLQIVGGWSGTVAATCPTALAGECAGRMLGVDQAALSPGDVA